MIANCRFVEYHHMIDIYILHIIHIYSYYYCYYYYYVFSVYKICTTYGNHDLTTVTPLSISMIPSTSYHETHLCNLITRTPQLILLLLLLLLLEGSGLYLLCSINYYSITLLNVFLFFRL